MLLRIFTQFYRTIKKNSLEENILSITKSEIMQEDSDFDEFMWAMVFENSDSESESAPDIDYSNSMEPENPIDCPEQTHNKRVEDGELHYKRKYFKRTKGKRIKWPYYLYREKPEKNGNARSSSKGHPATLKHVNFIFERTINNLTKMHKIVDWTPASGKPLHTLRVHLDEAVFHEEKEHRNLQIHDTHFKKYDFIPTHKQKKNVVPKFIHLPELHPNLYLSDINYVCSNAATLTCENQDNIDYKYFKSLINGYMQWLVENLNDSVVIVKCENGINLSAAFVAAYGILVKNMTFEEVRGYIDEEKIKKHPEWNNLTNKKLRTCLTTLQNDSTIERITAK